MQIPERIADLALHNCLGVLVFYLNQPIQESTSHILWTVQESTRHILWTETVTWLIDPTHVIENFSTEKNRLENGKLVTNEIKPFESSYCSPSDWSRWEFLLRNEYSPSTLVADTIVMMLSLCNTIWISTILTILIQASAPPPPPAR